MPLIKFDSPKDDHLTLDTWAVAVYQRGREYMGPEEGGWYWDSRELVALATADTADTARELALELEKGEFADRGRPLHSVNFGQGDDAAYSMYIVAPGKAIRYDNHDERPTHYE